MNPHAAFARRLAYRTSIDARALGAPAARDQVSETRMLPRSGRGGVALDRSTQRAHAPSRAHHTRVRSTTFQLLVDRPIIHRRSTPLPYTTLFRSQGRATPTRTRRSVAITSDEQPRPRCRTKPTPRDEPTRRVREKARIQDID